MAWGAPPGQSTVWPVRCKPASRCAHLAVGRAVDLEQRLHLLDVPPAHFAVHLHRRRFVNHPILSAHYLCSRATTTTELPELC